MKQQTIESVLLKIGIPANISGFYYIIDAIQYLDDHQNERIKYTQMYEIIGQMHNANASRVERSMRHAFEIARGSNADFEMAEYYIGFMNCSNSASLEMLYKRLLDEEAILQALHEKKAQQIAGHMEHQYSDSASDELIRRCVRMTLQEVLPLLFSKEKGSCDSGPDMVLPL